MILKSILLFVLAGLCEIGGGYLIWQAIRSGKGLLFGIIGAIIIVLYGIIPPLQQAHFGASMPLMGVFLLSSPFCGDGFLIKMFQTVLIS